MVTYAPKARVIVSPITDGAERPARVVSKVSDVDAYVIRLGDGRRLTVGASQLRRNMAKVSSAHH